jgi:hypothetical protein
VRLALSTQATNPGTAFGTRKDIAIAELGEFVTEDAFFVNRQTRRNGTRGQGVGPANLQYAKNGLYKWIPGRHPRTTLSH